MDLLTYTSGREFSGAVGESRYVIPKHSILISGLLPILAVNVDPDRHGHLQDCGPLKGLWSRSQDSQLAKVLLEVMFSFSVMLNGTILLTLQIMNMIDFSMGDGAGSNLGGNGKSRQIRSLQKMYAQKIRVLDAHRSELWKTT